METAEPENAKGLFGSYRRRRRLMWLVIACVAIGSFVAIGLIWPNTAPHENAAPSGPLRIDNTPPEAVRLTRRERSRALAVVERFLDTAVERKNVRRAWSLVAPEFRQGITRKQWNTGNMPVVPYPVLAARWRLEYSDVNGIGFSLALFPRKGSRARAQVFLIGLHTLGTGKRRHWVVDNWQPAPSRGPQSGGGGDGTTLLEQITPNPTVATGKAKESAAWLLLPVGLLGLALLIPLVLAGVNWYRARRAEALFGG